MHGDDVEAERRRLLSVAYRMTGTLADAEDIVQEAYLRWYRLDDAERAAIENPPAWLTRVASRIALDLLGSARHRRETYVGPWLPEPVPAALFHGTTPPPGAGDPLERVTVDDAVSTALLVVLESMTPAERVAFVLHDVFDVPFGEIAAIVERTPAAVRQLAATGRRHVRESRSAAVSRDEHDRTVRAFAAATRTGDVAQLMRVLAPGIRLSSDGGGVISAARNVVVGADRVARFLLGIAAKDPGLTVAEVDGADGLGFVFRHGNEVYAVMTLGTDGALVRDVWIVLNPAKLTSWT